MSHSIQSAVPLSSLYDPSVTPIRLPVFNASKRGIILCHPRLFLMAHCNADGRELRKLVKLQKRKQKEKKANIVSTLVRLGHLNFRLADGNCAVLCSTTNTALMGSVIIETKNNNDSNAPMDTKYKFIIKFQRKQADLVVPFTLLQQIIQRNGSNEQPYISLPLFQHNHSLANFGKYHENQVSTNGNHNHTNRRSRRSYEGRNNTSNESQTKRMKRNNRYNK